MRQFSSKSGSKCIVAFLIFAGQGVSGMCYNKQSKHDVLQNERKKRNDLHCTKTVSYTHLDVYKRQREYWIVDRKREKIVCYWFEGEDAPEISMYTFRDKVPVRIYDGQLEIDFPGIVQRLWKEE